MPGPLNHEWKPPVRPSLKAASTIKRLLGNPDAAEFDKICKELKRQGPDHYSRFPAFFGYTKTEDIPNVDMLSSMNEKQYNALQAKMDSVLTAMRASYPELVKQDKEEKWKASIIKGMFEDVERYEDATLPSDSNYNYDQKIDWDSRYKSILLKKFARDIAPELSYDQLTWYGWNKIKLISHDSKETISVHNRTSSWSTDVDGSIDLNGEVFEIHAWKMGDVNRI